LLPVLPYGVEVYGTHYGAIAGWCADRGRPPAPSRTCAINRPGAETTKDHPSRLRPAETSETSGHRRVPALAVGVAEVPAGGDAVTDGLLHLGRLGEALLLPVPDGLPVDPDDQHPARAGDQRDLAQLALERRQQLLRQPGRPRQPPALGAVLDLEPRLVHGGH